MTIGTEFAVKELAYETWSLMYVRSASDHEIKSYGWARLAVRDGNLQPFDILLPCVASSHIEQLTKLDAIEVMLDKSQGIPTAVIIGECMYPAAE